MEQLRVQWTEFPTSLTGALGQLQHAGELADVTLACEGRHIHAHKLVLSACSPYFRDAFKENPCHHPIIILKDVQAQDILNLLSYMYHGEVNVEEDSLPSFIQTAELLQIKGLSTSVTLQSKVQPPKPNLPISFQVKKNVLQPTSKKAISHPNNPLTVSPKSDTQKRRRNSASERLSDILSHDAPKKIKPAKEKCTISISKKADPPIPATDNSNSESNKNDTNNLASLPPQDNKTTEDTEPAIKVEIKHEVDDLPDFEDMPNDEPAEDAENTAPTSPPALYENSMLARSLLSGAQSFKADSPIGKPKIGSQLTITTVSTCRESTSVVTTPSSKFTISTDETVVKIERLSPRSDVLDIEPEVLISEQEDPSIANRVLLSGKNSGQASIRDQAGTSSSQAAFNQNNHAAICGDCPHCGTKYSNQSALKYHVRLMHSDLTNRLCCHLCPRSFTMRDTFKEHMWTSHGQRN